MEREAFYIVNASISDIYKLLHAISQIPAEMIRYDHVTPPIQGKLYAWSHAKAKKLDVFNGKYDRGVRPVRLLFYCGDKAYEDCLYAVVLSPSPLLALVNRPSKWFLKFRYKTDEKGKIEIAEIKILKKEAFLILEPEPGEMREEKVPVRGLIKLSFDFKNLTKATSSALMKVEDIIARSGRKVSYEEWQNELMYEAEI